MSGHGLPGALAGSECADLRLGLIRSVWNADVVDRLVAGVRHTVERVGAADPVVLTVAGALELPYAAQELALAGSVDAIVGVGTVIRGGTTHYELVAEGCAEGLRRVQLDTRIPVGFGVLTVENLDEGLARSEPPPGHNVGAEAADAALALAALARRLRSGRLVGA